MKRFTTILLTLFFVSCGKQSPTSNYSRSWTDQDRKFLIDNLESSLQKVMDEIDSLNEDQWNHRTGNDDWSIALVVEHLITHDELFSREVRVLSQLPVMTPQPDSLFAEDEEILSYSEITPQNIGRAPDYLAPLGRWCSKQEAITAYQRTGYTLIEYVEKSGTDFRKYYTTSGRGPTKYRDLHQLLLISIAHTKRHLQQIKNIKGSVGLPDQVSQN
jgi:hypothetical protein